MTAVRRPWDRGRTAVPGRLDRGPKAVRRSCDRGRAVVRRFRERERTAVPGPLDRRRTAVPGPLDRRRTAARGLCVQELTVAREARDRGQVTVEFLGMTPTILVTLVVLWQLVLVGYTFTLAGNAADEAVRAATAAAPGARQGACQEAGLDKLSGAWAGGATVNCATAGGFVTADVELSVPLLFPGTLSVPFDVKGHAGAVEEETD